MSELKPCPCCGTPDPELHLEEYRARYMCDNPGCGIQARWTSNCERKEAIRVAAEYWNRRPDPQPKPEPKFEVGQRVFVLAGSKNKWGIVNGYKPGFFAEYEVLIEGRSTYSAARALTVAPTWLEEFGDDKEGRIIHASRHRHVRKSCQDAILPSPPPGTCRRGQG